MHMKSTVISTEAQQGHVHATLPPGLHMHCISALAMQTHTSCAVFCDHREMKLTSPRLNLVMAVGGIIWYTSAAAITIPTTDLTGATALCEVRGGDKQFTLSIILTCRY